MSKIKPQIARRNNRTCLFNVRTENFLKCRVNKVGRSMISSSSITFLNIN